MYMKNSGLMPAGAVAAAASAAAFLAASAAADIGMAGVRIKGLFDLVLGPVGDTGAEMEAGTFLVGVLLVGMKYYVALDKWLQS